MPVYGAIIDRYNPDIIVAGTDFGLWSSSDGGNTWFQELAGMYNTPIYSVEQQPLYNEDCYVIYVASYGRGMFRSTTLTSQNNPSCKLTSGIIENKPVTLNRVNLYPNPVSDQLYLDLDLAKSGNVTIRVIDLLGRQMLKNDLGNQNLGKVKHIANVSQLPTGTYIVTIETALGMDTRPIVITR
jgi:hypothetical protein